MKHIKLYESFETDLEDILLRYLKTYESLRSIYEHDDYEEIYNTINDICLEFKHEYNMSYRISKMDYKHGYTISISVYKLHSDYQYDILNISDIESVMDRVNDYLKQINKLEGSYWDPSRNSDNLYTAYFNIKY